MKSIPQKSFSEILREERLLRGWKQAEVARKIGVDPNDVSRWERGLHTPRNAYAVKKLCNLFGKTPEEFGLLQNELEKTTLIHIIHVQDDEVQATRIEENLSRRGFSFRSDKEEKLDSPKQSDNMQNAFRDIQGVVVLASPQAQSSPIIKEELALAERAGCPIFVLWIAGKRWQDARPPSQMVVREIDAIDARESNFASALDELAEVLHRALDNFGKKGNLKIQPRNPYKGLNAFRLEDAKDFFGREQFIDQLIDEIEHLLAQGERQDESAHLLAIIGPSGAGKSSLMLAGLLPRLIKGEIPGSEHWLYLPPIVPGASPVTTLSLILESRMQGCGPSLLSIQECLNNDMGRGLHDLALQLVTRPEMKVVLVVDQFEELFTQTINEDERKQFIKLLVTASSEECGPVLILLSLRADFYDRPMYYPQLGKIIEQQSKSVFPLSRKELRSVIKGPAALADVQLTIEEQVVEELLVEMQDEPSALPLLQFVLTQLFERRSGRYLTLQTYYEIGGLKGALTKHAETTYWTLPTDEHRLLARSLFVRLIALGATEQDTTRRRATLSELTFGDDIRDSLLQEAIETFTRARLLTMNHVEEAITIEVSHEALIREWTRFAQWIRDARSDIQFRQTLDQDIAAWDERDHPNDRLYRGTQLDEAQSWAERNMTGRSEAVFLKAGNEERERQKAIEQERKVRELHLQHHAKRRQQYALGTTGIASIVIMIVLVLAVIFQKSALETQGNLLQAQRNLLQAQRSLLNSRPVSVTNLNDHGPGSLREAIETSIPGSAITFSRNLKGAILLTSGELKITKSLTINGPGASSLAISGGNKSRVFLVTNDAIATISNLTIEYGNAGHLQETKTGDVSVCGICGPRASNDFAGIGGGIYNDTDSTLIIFGCTVFENAAEDGGGGIENRGLLFLNESTINGNKATIGGGIENFGGGYSSNLKINDSNITSNEATQGGGLSNEQNLVLQDSTISKNKAKSNGGGISNTGNITIMNSTITFNTAVDDGGGIVNGSIVGGATIDITNSTISNNVAGKNGGGVANKGSSTQPSGSNIVMKFCTIYENSANAGGGIFTDVSTGVTGPNSNGNGVYFDACIVAGDRASTGPDILGAFSYNDVNQADPFNPTFYPSLIQSLSGSQFFNRSFYNKVFPSEFLKHFIIGESPDLGPLQNNGGATQTYALLPGSLAIDKIPYGTVLCGISAANQGFANDQRGMKRPDGNEQFCDIGAYEYSD